ncbi:MAG: hypothetical protein A2W85_09005 [Bacteroidetes bacterium GWF2_41_31]|nr:MAG: hypothetical protein A2W85_09005 [Bacteroidetes bacterium GWF2_41_31]
MLTPNIVLSQHYLLSGQEIIIRQLNGTGTDWRISPDLNPDRLEIYFNNNQETQEIRFITDVDSITFQLHNRDTIRFVVILNQTDTAFTEIVGVHDLPNKMTDDQKIYTLSLFWSEAKYNFANYDLLGFSWDSLYQATIPKALNTKNDYEFSRLLSSFAARLNDGHSQFLNTGKFSIYCDYAPLSLVSVEENIYIKSYRETLKNQLELGAKIVKIEGKHTKQYMEEEVLPYISASTEANKWMIGTSSFPYGLKSQPLTLTFRNSMGEDKTVQIERNGESTRYDNEGREKYQFMGAKPKYTDNLDLTFTDDSIALLTVTRFYPEEETIEQIEQIMPQLLKANGLVVDIRYNGGGSTRVAYSLIQRIIKQNYFLGLAGETRKSDAVYKAMGFGYDEYKPYYENNVFRQEEADTIRIEDTIKRIQCPVVILIGEYTFSAAEDFLIMLYEIQDRPQLIGVPTGGSTGAPLMVEDLSGDIIARICTRRCKFPYSGKPFIIFGIQPDITLYPTITQILNNQDVVMDKGIEVVRAKLASNGD